LAFLGVVDTTQPNEFRVVVVRDFEGVAVEDRNDLSSELSNGSAEAGHDPESEEICSSPPYNWR
jgi:hypothetical protein